MRSTQGPSGATYIHHGDYSGDVKIHTADLATAGDYSLIPFDDMLHLVAEFLRTKEISRWEQYSAEQILSRHGGVLE